MNLSPLIAQVSAEATEAQSLWAGFDGEQRFVLAILLIVFSGVIAIVLIGAGCSTWKAVKERQLEADIKRDMLDRGMTAEDIERVMSSQYVHWWGGWYYKK